jgi:serine/threonine protein kinase
VTPFQYLRDRGLTCFLAMERGDGGDLSDLISHGNVAGVDPLVVRSVAVSVARSLKFMNEEHRVLHGDVKARNFVMRAYCEVAAIDGPNQILHNLVSTVTLNEFVVRHWDHNDVSTTVQDLHCTRLRSYLILLRSPHLATNTNTELKEEAINRPHPSE